MNLIVKRWIYAITTGLSIVSLAFIDNLPLWIQITIACIGVACIIFLIYNETQSDKINERICTNDEEIKNTMKEIIKTQGKICIMSRDLSWVDSEVEACIIHKKDNILIFAEKEIDLTRRLLHSGVIIKYYGKLNFEPKTRFTIIRYNKSDPQVAIANTQNSIRKKKEIKHIIYQTASTNTHPDSWINSLAIDMISLCNLACEAMEHDQKN